MHEDLRLAVDELFPSLRQRLEALVRIPSVSATGYDATEVLRSAEATKALLEASGMDNVRLLELDGTHPAVYGELAGPPGSPTVLLYAHHDVQPPGPAEEWTSPPFEPAERHGRLYGRGTSDDKCGIVIHLGAIEAFRGSLPVGVKVFVEGEEEIGSAHLEDFITAYHELLESDVIVIADSANLETGTPSLTTSLRGLVDCVVEVRTLKHAVHSGLAGGVVPDALMALSRLLATLHDDDGSVAVLGLLRGNADGLKEQQWWRESVGIADGVDFIGSGSLESRMWAQPSISVLAVDAPPVAEAINQLVPTARAKVSLRLAPGQDPGEATVALVEHLNKNAPWGAQVHVTQGASAEAFELDSTGRAYDAFRAGFAEAWGRESIDVGIGGSIPFVSAFSAQYPAAAILLMGVADHKSHPHAPDESVDLLELRRGVLAVAIALQLLSA